MRFWLDCVPSSSTSQGKRANFTTGHFFKDKKEESWTQFLTGLLAPHKPLEPLTGPLTLKITYVWPLTAGDQSTKAKRAALDECPLIWHEQKPDWDNAPKSLVDVMAKLGFFVEDKQIVRATVTKTRGRKTGILISLESTGYLLRWVEDDILKAIIGDDHYDDHAGVTE